MIRVLLVTSSRSLARIPGAETWACEIAFACRIPADQWCARGLSAGMVLTLPRGWRHWTREAVHPLPRAPRRHEARRPRVARDPRHRAHRGARGARHIRKMWTTIPCPDCNDARPSCAYCGGTMVMRDGRSCDGGACRVRRTQR